MDDGAPHGGAPFGRAKMYYRWHSDVSAQHINYSHLKRRCPLKIGRHRNPTKGKWHPSEFVVHNLFLSSPLLSIFHEPFWFWSGPLVCFFFLGILVPAESPIWINSELWLGNGTMEPRRPVNNDTTLMEEIEVDSWSHHLQGKICKMHHPRW